MRRIRDKRGYMYVLPAMLLVALFIYYPFLKSFIYSFFTITPRGNLKHFVFLDNYRKLIANPDFRNAVAQSIKFTLVFLPLNTLITLASATVIRKESKFASLMGSFYILPLACSLSFSSLIFKEIFKGQDSIVNRFFGLDIPWLNTTSSAFWAIVILSVFLDFALDHVLLLGAFRKIDRSVIEAGRIDGANEAQRYFLIELPQIVPTLLLTIFMAFKDAMLISAPILTMTEGGPYRSTETIMYYYYLEAFKSSNRTAGAVISTLMILFSAVVIFIYYLVQRRRDHE